MKVKGWRLWGLIAALGVLAGVLWLAGRSSWTPIRRKLPDGTVLQIEQLTFGRNHSFSQRAWLAKLQRGSPRPLRNFLGQFFVDKRTVTNPDCLVVWLSRFDPRTDRYLSLSSDFHALLDEHGCTYVRTGSYFTRSFGRRSDAAFPITFEAFPRAEVSFRYRFTDASTGLVTEFLVPNPFRRPKERWAPEPVPITKTNGDLAIRLRRLETSPSGESHILCLPGFEFVNAGDRNFWQRNSIKFIDGAGNRSENPLCTNDSAWKIETTYLRLARASFRSDETWTVTNVAVPPPGGSTRLDLTNTIEGCEIRLIAVNGPSAIYAPSIPLEGPTLSIEASAEASGAKILVRAHDDQQRKLVTHALPEFVTGSPGTPSRRQQRFTFITMPDSNTLTIEVLVQKPRVFEFYVEPPRSSPKSEL